MKTKKIKIPIYHGNLIIVVDDNWERINKKYNTEIKKDFDGVVFKKPCKDGYMEYVVAFSRPPKGHIIAHEAVHVVNYIFVDGLIELDRYNDEPQAYLTEWVVRQIESFVNKKK